MTKLFLLHSLKEVRTVCKELGLSRARFHSPLLTWLALSPRDGAFTQSGLEKSTEALWTSAAVWILLFEGFYAISNKGGLTHGLITAFTRIT